MENYTEIWYRLQQIKMEIADIDDDYLMEEVLYLEYHMCDNVKDVVAEYLTTGEIKPEDRSKLENFYILVWIDEDTEE